MAFLPSLFGVGELRLWLWFYSDGSRNEMSVRGFGFVVKNGGMLQPFYAENSRDQIFKREWQLDGGEQRKSPEWRLSPPRHSGASACMHACTFMKHARAHLHSLMRTEKFACLAPACHVASCHAPGGQVATGIVFNRLPPTIQQVRPG